MPPEAIFILLLVANGEILLKSGHLKYARRPEIQTHQYSPMNIDLLHYYIDNEYYKREHVDQYTEDNFNDEY